VQHHPLEVLLDPLPRRGLEPLDFLGFLAYHQVDPGPLGAFGHTLLVAVVDQEPVHYERVLSEDVEGPNTERNSGDAAENDGQDAAVDVESAETPAGLRTYAQARKRTRRSDRR